MIDGDVLGRGTERRLGGWRRNVGRSGGDGFGGVSALELATNLRLSLAARWVGRIGMRLYRVLRGEGCWASGDRG